MISDSHLSILVRGGGSRDMDNPPIPYQRVEFRINYELNFDYTH